MVFPLDGFEFEAHTFGIRTGENDAVGVPDDIAFANNDVAVCVDLCCVHGLAPVDLKVGKEGANCGRHRGYSRQYFGRLTDKDGGDITREADQRLEGIENGFGFVLHGLSFVVVK